MSQSGVVIAGAGHAGFNVALALRNEKYDGPIRLLGAEGLLPYHRPPLSKTYIKGDSDDSKIWLRPEKFYTDSNIILHLSDAVESVDRQQKTVTTAEDTFAYDTLVIATGTKARSFEVSGSDLDGVEVIRALSDARRIRDQLPECESIVVIGGGFIGLEFAAAVNAMGKSVTVLEAAPRTLGRSVAPQTSDYMQDCHSAEGIEFVLNARVSEIIGDEGKVSAVRCEDGMSYPADLVIVGIGVVPESGIAEAAGLECNNGIVVDGQLRTSDRSVFAVGDCAAHKNRFAENREIRVESIQNATDQARTVARVISGSDPDAAFNSVPWFWSDQGKIKLQMVGLSYDADEFVLRGNPEDGKFSVFHLRHNILVAIDSINQASDHMAGRKLLVEGISPTVEQISDPEFRLKSLLTG